MKERSQLYGARLLTPIIGRVRLSDKWPDIGSRSVACPRSYRFSSVMRRRFFYLRLQKGDMFDRRQWNFDRRQWNSETLIGTAGAIRRVNLLMPSLYCTGGEARRATSMDTTEGESVELSRADVDSLERSARTIVENTSKDQRKAILDRMERAYLKLSRKYGNGDDQAGRGWAMAMTKRLRILVADIEQRGRSTVS
jgi:hypothetical protein